MAIHSMLASICSKIGGIFARRMNHKHAEAANSCVSDATPTRRQDTQDTCVADDPSLSAVPESKAGRNKKTDRANKSDTLMEKSQHNQASTTAESSSSYSALKANQAGFGLVASPPISIDHLRLYRGSRVESSCHPEVTPADSITAIDTIEHRFRLLSDAFVLPCQLDFLPGTPGDAAQMAHTQQNTVWGEQVDKLIGLVGELENIQTSGAIGAREAYIKTMNHVLAELDKLNNFKEELRAKYTDKISEKYAEKGRKHDRFWNWLTTIQCH